MIKAAVKHAQTPVGICFATVNAAKALYQSSVPVLVTTVSLGTRNFGYWGDVLVHTSPRHWDLARASPHLKALPIPDYILRSVILANDETNARSSRPEVVPASFNYRSDPCPFPHLDISFISPCSGYIYGRIYTIHVLSIVSLRKSSFFCFVTWRGKVPISMTKSFDSTGGETPPPNPSHTCTSTAYQATSEH